MSAFVIDASAMLAWCFQDEWPKDRVKVLQKLVEGGLAAPSHWPLELTNTIWNGERRGRLSTADAASFLSAVEGLGVEIDAETPRRAWDVILTLARAEKLTTYDAAYLELAMRTGATLVSKDLDLLSAARRCKVATLSVAS